MPNGGGKKHGVLLLREVSHVEWFTLTVFRASATK